MPAGHRLRYELEDSWAKDPVQGSDLGVKNVLQTEADMRNSIFCVCPPGMGLAAQGLGWTINQNPIIARWPATVPSRATAKCSFAALHMHRVCRPLSTRRCQTSGAHAGGTQDSTRVWRAIIYGCVPVTYFRAVELPFMRRLGIDYGQFSINIQPDDYDTTQARRAAPLLTPIRVLEFSPQTAAHSKACPSRRARQQCVKLLREDASAPWARVPW